MNKSLVLNIYSVDDAYAAEPTMTIGELQDVLAAIVQKHGRDYQVRVDTTCDQGQRFMAITGVKDSQEGYISIIA